MLRIMLLVGALGFAAQAASACVDWLAERSARAASR
jgi:hypothetical protein